MDSQVVTLSNRAIAQVGRRLKEYQSKIKDYKLKSRYVKYLIEEVIPRNLDYEQLKTYTLPLIASFVVTDGHMTQRKKKEITVRELGFSNKNTELVNAFNDLIFLTFNEVPSNIRCFSGMKATRYVASWHGGMIEELREYCYKNDKKDIEKILNCDKRILIECLRIAMSCDGFVTCYVSKDKCPHNDLFYNRIRASIELGCMPLNLRFQWEKITESLNLKFHIKKDRIRCYDYEHIEQFLNLGGFIPETFICGDSKFFEGVEKNNLAKALILLRKRRLDRVTSDKKEETELKGRVYGILK